MPLSAVLTRTYRRFIYEPNRETVFDRKNLKTNAKQTICPNGKEAQL